MFAKFATFAKKRSKKGDGKKQEQEIELVDTECAKLCFDVQQVILSFLVFPRIVELQYSLGFRKLISPGTLWSASWLAFIMELNSNYQQTVDDLKKPMQQGHRFFLALPNYAKKSKLQGFELCAAVKKLDPAAVLFLLQRGASANSSPCKDRQRTPLYFLFSAHSSSPDADHKILTILKFLLRHGADYTQRITLFSFEERTYASGGQGGGVLVSYLKRVPYSGPVYDLLPDSSSARTWIKFARIEDTLKRKDGEEGIGERLKEIHSSQPIIFEEYIKDLEQNKSLRGLDKSKLLQVKSLGRKMIDGKMKIPFNSPI